MTPEELTRRLAEADTQIVALRRATLELALLGRQLLENSKLGDDGANRSERPHRSPAQRSSGV